MSAGRIWDSPIPLAALEEGPQTALIEPGENARADIADRLGLESLKSFIIKARVKQRRDGDIMLSGDVSGEAERICVASLEPFIESVEDRFEIRFSEDADEEFDPAALEQGSVDDHPEPMPDGVIDIAEIGIQYYSLALSPHPRKPGAEALEDPKAAEEAEKLSPFAQLKGLKKLQNPQ